MNSTTNARSEIVGAEAFSLSGLVNYQDGSVVSRAVLKREEGNITIFAFDEGGLRRSRQPPRNFLQMHDSLAGSWAKNFCRGLVASQ